MTSVRRRIGWTISGVTLTSQNTVSFHYYGPLDLSIDPTTEPSRRWTCSTGLNRSKIFLWSAWSITFYYKVIQRELHREIIRLHDVPGISADCELTEVLRELAEIMIHGEKESDSYFEYVLFESVSLGC